MNLATTKCDRSNYLWRHKWVTLTCLNSATKKKDENSYDLKHFKIMSFRLDTLKGTEYFFGSTIDFKVFFVYLDN